MRISPAGISFIKRWEGFRSEPYQDIKGVWTIGYGSTHGITKDAHAIDKDGATQLLLDDMRHFEHAIETYIDKPLNQNQFDALCSLIYNVGTAPLQKTLGSFLNACDYQGAADQFLRWDHAGQVEIEGLKKRREEERKLFLTPTEEI